MIKHIYISFDFEKLVKKLPEITKDFHDKNKHDYAEITAKNITDGLRGLKDASKKARRRGVYWGGERVTPTSSNKPLVYTGRLLESIKMVDDGIEMMEYGIHHHRGFQGVAARPFLAVEGKKIAGTKYGKQTQKYKTEMFKKISKVLRSPKTYRF